MAGLIKKILNKLKDWIAPNPDSNGYQKVSEETFPAKQNLAPQNLPIKSLPLNHDLLPSSLNTGAEKTVQFSTAKFGGVELISHITQDGLDRINTLAEENRNNPNISTVEKDLPSGVAIKVKDSTGKEMDRQLTWRDIDQINSKAQAAGMQVPAQYVNQQQSSVDQQLDGRGTSGPIPQEGSVSKPTAGQTLSGSFSKQDLAAAKAAAARAGGGQVKTGQSTPTAAAPSVSAVRSGEQRAL